MTNILKYDLRRLCDQRKHTGDYYFIIKNDIHELGKYAASPRWDRKGVLMSAQAVSFDSFQAVTFYLNDGQKKEEYAIPIEQVREIRAVESITKVPKAKSYVKGIMNLRGLIIPVIDVKEKLGVGSDNSNSAKQRILVADVNGSLTGLLVDEVDQVMRMQTKDIEEAPQAVLESHNYIQGIAKNNDKLIVLLDAVRFLEDSSSEIQQAMEGSKQ